MDDTTRRALDGIADAVARRPPDGPVPLSDAWLRAVRCAERLPCNRPGSDESWVERALSAWTADVAGAERVDRG